MFGAQQLSRTDAVLATNPISSRVLFVLRHKRSAKWQEPMKNQLGGCAVIFELSRVIVINSTGIKGFKAKQYRSPVSL